MTPTVPEVTAAVGPLAETVLSQLRRMRTEAIEAILHADAAEEQARKCRAKATKALRSYERQLDKHNGALTLFEAQEAQ